MKNPFTSLSFVKCMFSISLYVVVTEQSTENCDIKYRNISTDCRQEACKIKGAGLHSTFSCIHYCYCKDGDSHGLHRTCPEGMIFNHLIENCDYPGNYTCPTRPLVPLNYKCPKQTGTFPYPGCCVLFLMCDHNIPHTFFCPANTHFSTETKNCEYPEIAGCRDKQSTTPPKTNTAPVITTPSAPVITTPIAPVITTPAEVTTTVTTPLPPGFKCPRRDGHFPDINNCSKYFHCSSNVAVHMSCSTPLHFNAYIRACDNPGRAHCRTGKDTIELSQPIGSCSKEGAEADENDCTKFYFCEYHLLFLETCPKGLIFIKDHGPCDIVKDSSKYCPERSHLAEISCPCHNCNFPDPENSCRYFQCVGGKAMRQKCYRGQSFRKDTNKCDLVHGQECRP